MTNCVPLSAKNPRPAASPGKPHLLIVGSTLHVGGAENMIACLARDIDRHAFNVTACFLKENGVVGEQMVREGVRLLPLPGRMAGQVDRLTSLKLRRLIKANGINLIHTHDVHGLIDGCICKAIVPGLRHVHTFHWGNYPERDTRYGRIEKLLWRIPDALVAVGHQQAGNIRKLYGIPADRIEVLWNGVQTPNARIATDVLAAVAGARSPIIMSISTLIEQKGLSYLVEAAALLKARGTPFLLLVVGEGHLRPLLETQAAAHGLADHIKFLGWVTEASERALPACDVFVQSSLWEAMSVVVLEAMASGKPMVVTRVGDNEHVVLNGTTGLTVPAKDAAALADGLQKLLSDAPLRQRLAAAAQERHAAQFTIQHMIDLYQSLYKRVLRL
jgi:glycosyltransferase involved in cell wall biosynthesis